MRERRYLEEVQTAKYPWGPIEFTLSQGIHPIKICDNHNFRNLQFNHSCGFTIFGGDMFLGNHAYK